MLLQDDEWDVRNRALWRADIKAWFIEQKMIHRLTLVKNGQIDEWGTPIYDCQIDFQNERDEMLFKLFWR